MLNLSSFLFHIHVTKENTSQFYNITNFFEDGNTWTL